MSDSEREQLLAECLEEYHRRRARAEPVTAEEFRARLDEHFEEFADLLAAETLIDAAIQPSPEEMLPRTFGDYTILGELGRGHWGVVYEAMQRKLGRKVALKVLRAGLDTDTTTFERFRREGMACAQVRHENIVEIHDAGRIEGYPYYSMALIEGRTLHDLIQSGETPEPLDLARGLAGVADALHALHEEGIIHRDVKPSNIMVEPDGRMVLADFGLARSAVSQTLTQDGQMLGTPLYMSPEQVLGRQSEVDRRSDIYGLGVTMYEALTGTTPFKAEELPALVKMILNERPRAVEDTGSDAPRELALVAMKAIEREKRDRYESAAELRDDLAAFAEGRPVVGRPVSGLRRALRAIRPWALGSAFPVAAAIVFLIWWGQRPATVIVACYPEARIEIGRKAVGSTPWSSQLPPGTHEFTFRLAGFKEMSERYDLSAGETLRIEKVLIARGPDDPDAQRALARELEIALATFEKPAVTRGGGGLSAGTVAVMFPRGAVRREDLIVYRVDLLDDGYEPDGVLRFVRNGEVLHEEPYDPARLVTEAVLPETVTGALEAGQEVTWGYHPRRGAPVTTTFELVAPVLTDRIAEIERKLAEQPEALLAHFRAQLYLDAGLYQAALAEARGITEFRPDSARGWAVQQEALLRLDLQGTRLWADVLSAIQMLPSDLRAGVFETE